jgi:NTE family protein
MPRQGATPVRVVPAEGGWTSLPHSLFTARRVGLALAGGGVLAAAHVGVLRALWEEGVAVFAMAGVSAGALVATLWAAGLDVEDLLRLRSALSWRHLDLNWPALLPFWRQAAPGLVRGHRLEARLRELLPLKDLADFPRPGAVVAADLAGTQAVCFASRPPQESPAWGEEGPSLTWTVGGEAARILHGTMAVPYLFAPVPYGDYLLADGVLVDPVPVAAVRAMGAEYVVAVDLAPPPQDLGDPRALTPAGTLVRAFHCVQDSMTRRWRADLTIRPRFSRPVGILDFRRIDEALEMGYRAAKEALKELRHAPEEAPHPRPVPVGYAMRLKGEPA